MKPSAHERGTPYGGKGARCGIANSRDSRMHCTRPKGHAGDHDNGRHAWARAIRR